MKALLLPLLLLSACAGITPDACRLDRVAELPLSMHGTVPVLHAEINGRSAALVLDTGSDSTVLTRTAARRLGVPEGTALHNVGGAGGNARVGVAEVASIALGPITVQRPQTLLTEAPRPPLDGVVGIDLLIDYELELDAPARVARLYRARPCLDARPAWNTPYAQLAVQQSPGSGHLFVSVLLDGQPLRGMLDSGASRSAISLQSAEDVGLSRKRLAALPRSRGQAINAEGVLVRSATFRTLQVGDTVLRDPLLAVIDLPAFAGDLLVGGDYLATRRLWFSFLLGRVFVAP